MAYFSVDDVDAAVKRVARPVARFRRPPEDTPFGRFAPCQDPYGASFTLASGGRPE
jgi:predicted enzyme related to lactoylglutathione lyase